MKPPATVDVPCPHCTRMIVCTLQMSPRPPKPGGRDAEYRATVPDLADQFAAHYRDAGHV